MASPPEKVTATVGQLAKMIDHSLLHPTMTAAETAAGLAIAKRYDVATACVKPYALEQAQQALAGTSVGLCPVIGFPHGNSATAIKVAEAEDAVRRGGQEIDMVINIGQALGGQWDEVEQEIARVNAAVVRAGAILKVIFETDYLAEAQIVRLCQICTRVGVAFVKTSTGYGFVKQANGQYAYQGATVAHLQLMRRHAGPHVQIKAAGGVRTLDDLLLVRALGVSRVGATATVAMLEEAKRRGFGPEPKEVLLKPGHTLGAGY
ncbi:MAG: hypothetical protein M1826_004256 [Phylliscum demangeonii]|nr:MAG: hypothetical protein M1826_004256 [Phylliscum demangeonii]